MKSAIIISLVLIVGLSIFLSGCSSEESDNQLDDFATCLTEEGVTMYGGFRCPHCKDVKNTFKDSWELIDYVECDPRGPDEQSLLCIEKSIEYYPTWELANGTFIVGAVPFPILSEATGCPIFSASDPVGGE